VRSVRALVGGPRFWEPHKRSFVQGAIYPTKTEASVSELPLDPDLAGLLIDHRARSTYAASNDFVFVGASRRPRWRGILFSDHIKPATVRLGLGHIGWHTFRHSSTLLHALGAAPAVQKELLRHADIQTTMDIYTQAIMLANGHRPPKWWMCHGECDLYEFVLA